VVSSNKQWCYCEIKVLTALMGDYIYLVVMVCSGCKFTSILQVYVTPLRVFCCKDRQQYLQNIGRCPPQYTPSHPIWQ